MTAPSPAVLTPADAAAPPSPAPPRADDGRVLRRFAPWLLAYWVFLAAVGVFRDLWLYPSSRSADGIAATVLRDTALMGVWAAVCLVVIWITGRPGVRARGVAPTLGIAVLLTGAAHAAQLRIACVPFPTRACPAGLTRTGLSLAWLPVALLVTINLVAVGNAVHAALRSRAGVEAAARASASLVEAQLAALSGQLRPHFLFNTLQSVATLMHRDPDAAEGMLARLRTLLERSASVPAGGEVSLRQELEMMRIYAELEMQRFGDRLRVDLQADPRVLDAAVPLFLLQPLIENAVHHAVAVRGEGWIRVGADVDAGTGLLRVTIHDSGAGGAPGQAGVFGGGMGLANTRARLRTLHGDRQYLRMGRADDGGTFVSIALPLRPVEAADEEG
ncbi:sensor histidine kinase [Longimicrobium sp.]|uniref:sensor histidine kinase n=1 Tax=Longimicrobium sp. TaxID=2029185 RepID=UPI002E314748|nr:histidine kinase [Longimicrobium sp.]HEX6042340.1 histidine kinase [Longimicrobium sp.]